MSSLAEADLEILDSLGGRVAPLLLLGGEASPFWLLASRALGELPAELAWLLIGSFGLGGRREGPAMLSCSFMVFTWKPIVWTLHCMLRDSHPQTYTLQALAPNDASDMHHVGDNRCGWVYPPVWSSQHLPRSEIAD